MNPGKYSGLSNDAIRTLAEPKLDRANLLNVQSASPADAQEAAQLYGECVSVARDNKFYYLEKDALSRYAQLLASVQAPKRDIFRARASELFLQLGEFCQQHRDREMAAIALTNGALCLLEMSTPSRDQLHHARKLCNQTISMRRKNSADYAYSAFNLALAERRMASYLRDSEKTLAYSRARLYLKRAMRVFKKLDSIPVGLKATYHQNVLELLLDWFSFEVVRARHTKYESCVPSSDTNPEDWGIPTAEYARLARANPIVFGYADEPEWLPSEPAVVSSAIDAVPDFSTDMEAAEAYLGASTLKHDTLELALFKLRSAITACGGPPAPPIRALDSIWDSGQKEVFFNAVTPLISWEDLAVALSDEDILRLCRRIYQCLVFFRAMWSEDDIQSVLRSDQLSFRFAACQLARLEAWKDAYLMLEASRGLKSSKTIANDPTLFDSFSDEISWVHVTHSPQSSYAIVRQNDRFSGACFPKLSGKDLTGELMSFALGGLLVAGSADRAAARSSAQRIESMLTELSAWICKNTTDVVALIPGGYYQGFPLWAVGDLGTRLLEGTKRITTVPSRSVAYELENRRPSSKRLLRTIAIEAAYDVAGIPPLNWSKHEPALVKKSVPETWEVVTHDATAGSITESLRTATILHFTGHSKSSFDPLQSSLFTHGQPVSVMQILSIEACAALAYFGSCESGLARNDDEMLSIQTASYYAGVCATIGTTWAISDPVGFGFAAAFYESLSTKGFGSSDEFGIDDAYESYVRALAWLRETSIGRANETFNKYGAPTLAGSADVKAFDFYDWAAFGFMGVRLDTA